MAVVGIKLGRHSVQAALWSENAGHAVEAHLAGLETEVSWTPVLSRDQWGRLSWGEDVWARLHDAEPLEFSLLEHLAPVAVSGATFKEGPTAPSGLKQADLERLLADVLWPEAAQVAGKELRGGDRHRLGLALTLPPDARLRAALARSLPESFELSACESVSACSLAGLAREWGDFSGTVAHVHLGGGTAMASVWDVRSVGGVTSLQQRAEVGNAQAGLTAILAHLYDETTSSLGLLRVEEPTSDVEREQVRRLRLDVLRRLAQDRAAWQVAWQYEVPPDFRHLAHWVQAGPAVLPAQSIRSAIGGAADPLRSLIAEALAAAGVSEDAIMRVAATGRGATQDYLLPALQERFGKDRCPTPRRPETVPALGAATLARTDAPFSITRGEAAGKPARKSRKDTAPATPVETSRVGAVGIGLALGAERTALSWVREGAGAPDVIPFQGRRTCPSTAAILRAKPDVVVWGTAAEALMGERERYAVVSGFPQHFASGARFVLNRAPSGGEPASVTPEELLARFSRTVLEEASAAVRRLAPDVPGAQVAAAWPSGWSAERCEAARTLVEAESEWSVRTVEAPLAALLSTYPPPGQKSGMVLLAEAEGVSAAFCSRSADDWEVRGRAAEGRYGADFCEEVLARFLTDELNGRFARSFRYADLIRAAAGTEQRVLGAALKRAGEELAERLIRADEGQVKLELRLPGGGTAVYEAAANRDQWDGWAGKRVREAVGKVLSQAIGSETPPGRLALAGVGASVPLFQRAAADFCRPLGIEVELHPQPDVAVALGAALQAASWAAGRLAAGRPDLAIMPTDAPKAWLGALSAAAEKAGLRLGDRETAREARLVLALVSGPFEASDRQDFERFLRKGVPILPLRLPPGVSAGTPGASAALDTLSAADREQIERLLAQARRILGREQG